MASRSTEEMLREGEALFADGQLDGAEQQFRTVLEQQPTNKYAINNLGVIGTERHDFPRAEQFFHQALSLDPLYRDALDNVTALRKAFVLPPAAMSRADNAPSLTGCKLAIVNSCSNKFTQVYSSHFSSSNEVRIVSGKDRNELVETTRWADLTLSAWADEQLVELSHLGADTTIVTFIRSYEILAVDLIKRVDWRQVAGNIFVADHVRAVANNVWGEQLMGVPQVTIYNSVTVREYPLHNNGHGKNICFVGYINSKKGIGPLVQWFREILDCDSNYKLHFAGDFQELRFEVYLRHMIQQLELTDNVEFHGWVDDVPRFLQKMNYVISSSPWEGCPNNIIETMACGIKPLVHNWLGASQLFGDDLCFSNGEQLMRLLKADYDPVKYRRLIENNFDTATQLAQLDAYLAMTLAHRNVSGNLTNAATSR